MLRGVSAGNDAQSGSRSRIAATVSENVSRAKGARPVSISKTTQPNAQMSVRLSTGCPRRLLRAHVGGRAQNHARLVVAGDGDRRRLRDATSRVDPASSASIAFARPKSSTLTVPSGAHLDVRRLQIAMDDALLVRRFERLGDLPRDRQRFVERHRALRAMRSASVGPSTSSITSARVPSASSRP